MKLFCVYIGSQSLVWLGTSPGGSESIILLAFLHLVRSFLYLVDNLVTVHCGARYLHECAVVIQKTFRAYEGRKIYRQRLKVLHFLVSANNH